MRLRVVDTNFFKDFDWIFKLIDEKGNYVYIMNKEFYNNHKIVPPISKYQLDYLDKGYWLNCEVQEIDGLLRVIKIIK